MSDRLRDPVHGCLDFRYLLHGAGGLTVWYRFNTDPPPFEPSEGAQLEAGPLEIDQAAADELGALLERANSIVIQAQARRDADQRASEPREDERGRMHTDPFALRRPRKP